MAKLRQISEVAKRNVKMRDGNGCVLCGNVPTELHHYKSRAQGGSDYPENLVSLCRMCHEHVHFFDLGGFKKQALTEYLADLYASPEYIWNNGELEEI
jgi:5-methylcytosine-specific restriction endonuclease McrA